MANKKTNFENEKVVLRGEMNKPGDYMTNASTGLNSSNAVDYGDVQNVKMKIQKKGYKKARKDFF